ncbi:HTH DNA binding domain protein [Mycobacterium phage Sparkdehlily]|uniref:HTH DNA binding domain protein n=1 Tax=Mycobacterium phage Sparkdehlily TaxID=1739966 RepID=A0A0S1S0U7_9CAUD|nr:transcriptional repressor [Mycobacterium phage Sparkdehlily]ALM02197.1 HTH DNA binding domain protein [Mycobacterium phage Sparkdehlily]
MPPTVLRTSANRKSSRAVRANNAVTCNVRKLQACNCKESGLCKQWTLHLFAREHVGVNENKEHREDWPFGPELKRHRERVGLSQREASRRTTPPGSDKPAVSAGRWKQLETGWQINKGTLIPIGTTASTVAAAARAVQWDVNEALAIAGFQQSDIPPPLPEPAIVRYSDDELLAEVRRRLQEARNVMETTQTTRTPREARQDQEGDLDAATSDTTQPRQPRTGETVGAEIRDHIARSVRARQRRKD